MSVGSPVLCLVSPSPSRLHSDQRWPPNLFLQTLLHPRFGAHPGPRREERKECVSDKQRKARAWRGELALVLILPRPGQLVLVNCPRT